MSKSKALNLYQNLKGEREKLVRKYESNGEPIRFDVAIGLAIKSTAAGTTNASAVTVRTKTVPHIIEDGTVVPGNRTVIDFAAVKAANIADGIPSGNMIDALRARASNKVVELYSNDAALAWGMILLADVPCLLRIMNDINSIHASTAPGFTATVAGGGVIKVDAEVIGLVHSLPGKVETQALTHRGFFKPHNYRGDFDYLTNPVSLWSQVDKSNLSTSLLGVNSLFRLYGKDQIIDLNGRTVDVHERPNEFAGFACVIDLNDGHFASLTAKSAQNAFIYSSTGTGRLGRSNHFAIRGHFVRKLLVEGIQVGDKTALNKGPYFGTAIFNDSSEIVFKDVHQEQTIHHAPRSSLGLNWYADLTMYEFLSAKFVAPTTFNAAGLNTSYPWMKWVDKLAADPDTFANGKATLYPIIRTVAELEAAGVPSSDSQFVRDVLVAAQEAYRSASKNADDVYTQVNVGHGKNFVPLTAGKVLKAVQMARTTNLVVAQPLNKSEGVMYPDSVSYGFRAGSTAEGVGNLASQRGSTAQDVYLIDCSFNNMNQNMMETVSIASDTNGIFKTFNGQALRPFGYSNNRNPVAGIAASSMHLSQEAIKETFKVTSTDILSPGGFAPYQDSALDTCVYAFNNTNQSGFTNTYASSKDVSGLYKGHDVIESSLATLTAIAVLSKYFTAAAPSGILSGLNNSNMDIGILAWRYSMMNAMNAMTANHIGLKGGYAGDLTDRVHAPVNASNEGEIYPWFKSKATNGIVRIDGTETPSTIVDKDADFEAAKAIAGNTTRNRALLTSGYLASELPEPSDNLFKFKIELINPSDIKDGIKLKLVKALSGNPVLYSDCESLLKINSIGLNTELSTKPVEYKIVNGLDGQNHVHKGTFGIRLDQITDSAVIHCKVDSIESSGFLSEFNLIGNSADLQAAEVVSKKRPGSHVNEVHGLSINGVTNCYVEDFELSNASTIESIFGIEVQGQSKNVEINGASFSSLQAGHLAPDVDSFSLSGKVIKNDKQKCIGLRTSDDSSVVFKNIVASEISGPASENVKTISHEM